MSRDTFANAFERIITFLIIHINHINHIIHVIDSSRRYIREHAGIASECNAPHRLAYLNSKMTHSPLRRPRPLPPPMKRSLTTTGRPSRSSVFTDRDPRRSALNRKSSSTGTGASGSRLSSYGYGGGGGSRPSSCDRKQRLGVM